MTKVPPYSGPPISRRISRAQIESLPRYVKIKNSVGYEKTFPEKIWEDDKTWFDKFVWDE